MVPAVYEIERETVAVRFTGISRMDHEKRITSVAGHAGDSAVHELGTRNLLGVPVHFPCPGAGESGHGVLAVWKIKLGAQKPGNTNRLRTAVNQFGAPGYYVAARVYMIAQNEGQVTRGVFQDNGKRIHLVGRTVRTGEPRRVSIPAGCDLVRLVKKIPGARPVRRCHHKEGLAEVTLPVRAHLKTQVFKIERGDLR